jgi:hypothetical protein
MNVRVISAAVSAAIIGSAMPAMAASILIDNFDVPQAVYDDPIPPPQASQAGSDGNANIIGGYRDLYVETDQTGVDNATELRAFTSGGVSRLAFNNDEEATGRGWVTYDGSNAVGAVPASLDTTGLGDVDLLLGGSESVTGFLFDILFADGDLDIEIRAWDMLGNIAVYAETLPPGGGNPFVPFAAFSGSIDWSRIGALQFFAESGLCTETTLEDRCINGRVGGLDGAISQISVSVIPLPAPALLLLGGLGGLGALRLRKRKA